MAVLVRIVAAYLVLTAVAVAANFLLTPWYHAGGDAPFTVWEVMDWFMAAAILLMLAFNYAYKRSVDADESADVKRYIGANTVFHVTIAVLLLFFVNWFSLLSPDNDADGQVWTVVNTVLPIVAGATGLRLWRTLR